MEPTSKPAKTSALQPKKRRWIRGMFNFFMICFLFILLAAIGVGSWAYAKGSAMYKQVDLEALNAQPPHPTVFYDVKGHVINELTNAKIELVSYKQIPKTMIDAIVSVEDARFFEHNGVDLYAMARAFYRNYKSGETVQGGSTITQQLAKTMLYSPEQTYTRKINEAVASLKIEQSYTKEQILELYLNHIFYGENSWGLQRAAQTYFGKEASQLTLAESALLAGLPKAPSNYSPVAQPEKARDRRNLVLNLMAEQGKITIEERDKAKLEPLKLFDKSTQPPRKYASYVDEVIREASLKYGMDEQQILSGGYRIHTNLNPEVQDAAEEVYRNKKFFAEDQGGLQSGIVLLDSKTGAVRGIVGSRSLDSKEFRGFNYATQNERQPGSTIKPIIVYAPALMKGLAPQDMVNDVETDFGTEKKAYIPNNHGKKFHGWVTLEEALAQSYNIPAVAVLKEVGIGPALDFAKQTGLPLTDNDRNFSIALGAMTKGTSPLKMAQAYTVFANQGKVAEAYTIAKIVDSTGRVTKEAKPVTKQILDPAAAYTMTQMLQKVVQEGTGTHAKMDRPVAGKTGTTQLPDIAEFRDKAGNVLDGSKDAWFVGYTPEMVAAVWVGYPQTNKTHYLTSTGGKMPAAVFKEVMTRALKGQPVTAFAPPKGYSPMIASGARINDDGSFPSLASETASAVTAARLETLAPAASASAAPSASSAAGAPSASPGAPGAAPPAAAPPVAGTPVVAGASTTAPAGTPGGPVGAPTATPKPAAPSPTPGAGASGGAATPAATPGPGASSASGAKTAQAAPPEGATAQPAP